MRTLHPTRPHTTAPGDGRPTGVTDDMPVRRPSPRRVGDAVIAGYIHELSHGSRHRIRGGRLSPSQLRRARR